MSKEIVEYCSKCGGHGSSMYYVKELRDGGTHLCHADGHPRTEHLHIVCNSCGFIKWNHCSDKKSIKEQTDAIFGGFGFIDHKKVEHVRDGVANPPENRRPRKRLVGFYV